MLKSLITLAIAVAIAFISNPSPERHREKIQQSLSERSLMSKALGIGALTAFASNYRSVGVGSYTVVNDKLVSVGLYGMVFVMQ